MMKTACNQRNNQSRAVLASLKHINDNIFCTTEGMASDNTSCKPTEASAAEFTARMSQQQMSYIHQPHTSPIEHRTLFQLLDQHAAEFPDKEAIVYRDEKYNRTSITFKQYKQQSQALAASLLELGLRRGDKVLVLLSSSLEFAIVHMALSRVGAIAIFVEADADVAITELRQQINGVIYTEINSDVIDAVAEVTPDDNIKVAICVGSQDNLPNSECVSKYEALVHIGGKSDLSSLRQAEAEVQFDDPTVIICTSGSTGKPKPILYTHHGFVNGACSAAHTFNVSRNTIHFCDAPFDWIPGIGFSLSLVSLVGITLVAFPPKLSIKGHVTGIMLKIIAEEKCTHSILLSHFFVDMLKYEGRHSLDVSHLRVCLTGGQLMDRSLLTKVFEFLPEVSLVIGYGATETFMPSRQVITRINISTIDYGATEVNPGFEAMIVDSEGRMVPVETPGELYIRGAGLLHSADALQIEGVEYKNPKTRTGWFPTRDWAAMTKNGKLRLLGRVDNLIKCATESIQPLEIESVLSKHEKIASVIAIGVPDQRLYEVVCACVILKSGCQDNKEDVVAELYAWCKGKFYLSSNGLSPQPKYYVILEKYPKTRTGKWDRKALTKVAIDNLGL